ncbi:hypothetical protein AVEN_33090-1 [Araneus ventricosus]|uniref:Uncharacterized protein n=1 Tax=Araneus ventricosus TaxID=182803 RepID=A0A4Y2CTJ5_ARAVE|nr:hypothetical protein AVEN_33090-1 [Araneus ventricosus]
MWNSFETGMNLCLFIHGFKRISPYPFHSTSRRQGPNGKVSASELERPRFETRFLQRPTMYADLVHLKSAIVGQTSSNWRGAEAWRGGASSDDVLVI